MVISFFNFSIMWHIDPLLCNDRETNNETTAIAIQELRRYATVLQPLLCSGSPATMEVLLEAVFSMWSASEIYHSTDRVSAVQWSGAS
jgi:hypothetical protein